LCAAPNAFPRVGAVAETIRQIRSIEAPREVESRVPAATRPLLPRLKQQLWRMLLDVINTQPTQATK